MSKMTPEEKEEQRKAINKAITERIVSDTYGTEHWKHWRAWGSWFSWGSPTGLGLFFIAIAVSIWIICQAF